MEFLPADPCFRTVSAVNAQTTEELQIFFAYINGISSYKTLNHKVSNHVILMRRIIA